MTPQPVPPRGFIASLLTSEEDLVKALPTSLPAARNSRAFTLVELAVVLVLIFIGACMVAHGVARTAPNVRSVRCLSNLRRLMTGWQMYANDNQDKLIGVVHGAYVGDGYWVVGWLDWTTSSDNKNTNYLVDPRYARIAPYVHRAADLFKCPADQYLSNVQRTAGFSQRVRSYSAQVGMGAGNAESGPWDSIYKHATRTSDLLYPSPGESMVFVEEHPDSINEGAFFPPYRTVWVDAPATYHNGGCNFGFADGHSEFRHWKGSLLTTRTREVRFVNVNMDPYVPAGDPDLHWMSSHTQRVSTNSY
jgi:prepilin-type processing-associated H-X9-DG protein